MLPVIIASYNRLNLLKQTLASLKKNSDSKLQIIVVDSSINKEVPEYLEKLKGIMQGDTLQVIGNIREWNSELYALPEIIKKVDPRWLLVRKLEIQNSRKNSPISKNSLLKDSIMKLIKDAESEGGIDTDKIIMDTEANPNLINTEIKKLLEEGLIYEPRPGKIRYLG